MEKLERITNYINKMLKPILLIVAIFAFIKATQAYFFDSGNESITFDKNTFMSLVYLLGSSFCTIMYNRITFDKSYTETSDYYSILEESLIRKKSEKDNDTTDVLKLMTINMKEIKDYYVLSKNMAKKSFTLSVTTCILGFILISTAIISLFVLNVNLSSVIIPVVGGAIVEVIAGTSLIVYKQSLVQLNKYYEALHDNERFLSIVNIVNKITPEKRDDVYIQIINSQFKK